MIIVIVLLALILVALCGGAPVLRGVFWIVVAAIMVGWCLTSWGIVQ